MLAVFLIALALTILLAVFFYAPMFVIVFCLAVAALAGLRSLLR